jgi:hypothetical protein
MVFLDDGLLKKLQEVEGPSYKEILWSGGVIYGGGGFNRYYVNIEVDGELKYETFEPNEVLFSAFHACTLDIPKAEKAGFRIFD